MFCFNEALSPLHLFYEQTYLHEFLSINNVMTVHDVLNNVGIIRSAIMMEDNIHVQVFDNIVQNISHEWAEVVGESLDIDNEHVVDKCINGAMLVKAFSQWLTICNVEVSTKPCAKWSEETGYDKNDLIEEWESVCLLYKLPKNPLIQDFHLLFINRAFQLNNIIAKYRDVSIKCTLCGLVPETYVHLFYDCTLVKPIWIQLQDFLKRNLDDSELFTKKNCLLSTFDTSLVSLMSIIVK